jgi:hypothetical protein
MFRNDLFCLRERQGVQQPGDEQDGGTKVEHDGGDGEVYCTQRATIGDQCNVIFAGLLLESK